MLLELICYQFSLKKEMAIPSDRSTILTNFSSTLLEEVLGALERKEVQEVPGSHSLFAGLRSWEIDYKGTRYQVTEDHEIVESVFLVKSD